MVHTEEVSTSAISRRSMLGFGSLMAVGVRSAAAKDVAESRPADRHESSDDPLLSPADATHPDVAAGSWDPITLFDVDGRYLECISLLPATSQMVYVDRPQDSPMVRLKKVHYEETDPELLEFVSTFLPNQPLCFAVPDDVGIGWGGSGMPIALVRMRTNVDTFWVSITNIGFALGSIGAVSSNIFFSPTLAMALDTVYERATGKHFPEKLIDALSGKRHLDREFTRFAAWRARQK